jgi:hypothetical protein
LEINWMEEKHNYPINSIWIVPLIEDLFTYLVLPLSYSFLKSSSLYKYWNMYKMVLKIYQLIIIITIKYYHHKKSCVPCWQGTSRSFVVALSIKQTTSDSSQPAHQASCELIGKKVSPSSLGRLWPPLGAGCTPPCELVPLHKSRIEKS